MEELTRVFKEKKQVLADIEQEILVLEGKQDEITETINQEEQVLKYLQAESTKLDGELADQETKKARALSQAEKYFRLDTLSFLSLFQYLICMYVDHPRNIDNRERPKTLQLRNSISKSESKRI